MAVWFGNEELPPFVVSCIQRIDRWPCAHSSARLRLALLFPPTVLVPDKPVQQGRPAWSSSHNTVGFIIGAVKEVKLERICWLYMKRLLHQVSYTRKLLKLINNLTFKQNRQKHMTSKFKHMKSVCSGQVNNMFCKIMIKV